MLLQFFWNIHAIFHKNEKICINIDAMFQHIPRIFWEMKEISEISTNIAVILLQYFHESSNVLAILSQYSWKVEKKSKNQKLREYSWDALLVQKISNIPAILLQKNLIFKKFFWIIFGQTIFRQYSCNVAAILFNIPATLRTFGVVFRQYCLNIRCY